MGYHFKSSFVGYDKSIFIKLTTVTIEYNNYTLLKSLCKMFGTSVLIDLLIDECVINTEVPNV